MVVGSWGMKQNLHFTVDSLKIHCFSLLQKTILILLHTSFLRLLLALSLKVIMKDHPYFSAQMLPCSFIFFLEFFLVAEHYAAS